MDSTIGLGALRLSTGDQNFVGRNRGDLIRTSDDSKREKIDFDKSYN
jgi:hypothetical protein